MSSGRGPRPQFGCFPTLAETPAAAGQCPSQLAGLQPLQPAFVLRDPDGQPQPPPTLRVPECGALCPASPVLLLPVVLLVPGCIGCFLLLLFHDNPMRFRLFGYLATSPVCYIFLKHPRGLCP